METLCGQGYGAKAYKKLGIYLQASCIISFSFCVLLSIFWWFSDSILILLHQDPAIAKSAGLYLRFLIPGLFAYGVLQNLLRFLQTQSVVIPLVLCSALPLILHIGIAYSLTRWTYFPFTGAALATSISYWVSVVILALYVLRSKNFVHTWDGFSMESFNYVIQTLKLALPCAAMVWLVNLVPPLMINSNVLKSMQNQLINYCYYFFIVSNSLEYCAFEILVLVAGLMPNSEVTTSLIAMWYVSFILSITLISPHLTVVFTFHGKTKSLRVYFFSVNTENISFMVAYGLSAAAR